jgi:hypothetical protein
MLELNGQLQMQAGLFQVFLLHELFGLCIGVSMNRRELMTGAAALAAVAVQPAVSETGEKMYKAYDQKNHLGSFFGESKSSRTMTTVSVVDDPDVEQILISVLVKDGASNPLDSYVIERALLKHVGTNLISWFKYCRDNSMKTL